MEKKIARISRWLDRCSRACSARSWKNALLDMECAKAELEEARSELWIRAERDGETAPSGKPVRLLCISSLSILLLLSVAAPVAIQPAFLSQAISEPALEWVTSDEKALLAALRKNLSEANLAYLSEGTPSVSTFQPGERAEKERARGVDKKNVPAAKQWTSRDGDMDSILALVQIGQNALRQSDSPIRFDK
ncbi:MAG: hypothetical protein GX791_09065 [Synergistaceae bacterium]|nr:hypothetical protein [Synergistaceae bacterium]